MNDEPRDRPNDAYLWDGTGVPDPDVVGLEKTLGVLRHRGRLPDLSDRAGISAAPRPSRGWWLAAAAGLLIVAGGAWLAIVLRSASWSVNSIAGAPAIGERAVVTRATLKQGEWLVTDNRSRARIAVGTIGNVDVEPNTRLQMIAAGREHRMALDRGTIHARIWAPPKLFFVNTQAAVAVDLGCAYTLHVDEHGQPGCCASPAAGSASSARDAIPTFPKAQSARCAATSDRERPATRTRPRGTARR
jgi:hypothetical protein